MKGATAVSSATMLVARHPIQPTLVLVRIQQLLMSKTTMIKYNMCMFVLHPHPPMGLFLHVAESPRITIHPHDIKNTLQGKCTKFTIQATGTQPLSYHWQWKPAEEDSEEWQLCDTDLSNGATLTIPSVQKSNEGSYRCVVSNCGGSQTSNPAKLEVS